MSIAPIKCSKCNRPMPGNGVPTKREIHWATDNQLTRLYSEFLKVKDDLTSSGKFALARINKELRYRGLKAEGKSEKQIERERS